MSVGGSRARQAPRPSLQIRSPVPRRQEGTGVERFHDVGDAERPLEMPPRPERVRVGVRRVDDPVLGSDPLHDLFDPESHRNPLAENEADELGAAPALDLLAHDHQLPVHLPRLERSLDHPVIGHREPPETRLTRSLHELSRRQEGVRGVPGVSVKIHADPVCRWPTVRSQRYRFRVLCVLGYPSLSSLALCAHRRGNPDPVEHRPDCLIPANGSAIA